MKASFDLDEHDHGLNLMSLVSNIDIQDGDDSEIVFDERMMSNEEG